MLICAKAYANEADQNRIYCSVTDELCAHQYWCDMACKWKNTNQAAKCPGKEKKNERRKTEPTDKVNNVRTANKKRK